MCCFCQESTAYEVARVLTQTNSWSPEVEQRPLFDIALLMECRHLLPVLLKYEQHLYEDLELIKTHEFETKALRGSLTRIAFCRMMETLIVHGFDSEEYHSLITTPVAFNILKVYRSLQSAVPDGRLFLNDSLVASVLQDEFFFTKDHRNSIRNDPRLISDCVEFLTRYIDWWCYRDDENSWLDDYNYVETYFPYVYFSFLVVAKFQPDDKLFARMISNTPVSFGASLQSLWLQRKAAIALYDLRGLQAFLPYPQQELRPSLIYYLVVKEKLDTESKHTLREAILKSGKYKPDKDVSFAKKRGFVYMAPEAYLMEQL
jgi:hypothetical protein